MSLRDENRHLDIKREVNFRMSALIDRYWQEYGCKKKSQSREKAVLDGIREEMGQMFVREATGEVMRRWYAGLTETKGLSEGTALRHFNVMHHMMGKAATVWCSESGIDRNPADDVDVVRPDDQRDRYLSAEEVHSLKQAIDEKMYRKGSKEVNQTFYRLRLIVLLALTTGMRIAEVFGLKWSDLLFNEELIAVGAKLKGGKFRYVPLTPELASELKRYPVVLGEDRILPPEPGAITTRQRVDKSFETVLEKAGIKDFRFHDLRHTFASWYMMNGGDLYELAKILGHSNIKMTERYAKLAKSHIAKTGSTARGMWVLMAGEKREQARGIA
jgi:integrase